MMMLREQIRNDVAKAIKQLTVDSLQLTEIEVTRTSDAKFGDYTTNVALKIAKVTKGPREPKEPKGPKVEETSGSSGSSVTSGSYQSPLEFANILADSLKSLPYVEKLEVAGPGFINFFVKSEVWQSQVSEVLNADEKYGSNQIGRGKKARVEFVSANPTGPLHFGNARGGPIGDVLAFVLEFCGYKVLREYLHNDIGGQVDKLGQSIINVSGGQKLEDQEYKGTYITELAKKIGKVKDSQEAGKKAVDLLLREILKDCRNIGIKFDQVYSESEFAASGQTKAVLDHLRERGVLREKEGALWFAPTDEFLKDRETVVVKSDGSYTYFANDIAYHNLKFQDNPDLVLDIFGANHHGHVPRLQAAILALGYDVTKFKVILYQWVRFRRGSELVKMSKRAGTFVTVREVLDEVGRDALRFFILMHDPNTHMDFDLDLAKKKSQENPVYYVQYAHARICSILAKTKDERLTTKADYKLLTTNYELDLIRQITRLPELVEDLSQSFAVHRLTAYAVDLADSFHRFYENCRVIGGKKELMATRMALILATKTVLANTLYLLGISAPEKM